MHAVPLYLRRRRTELRSINQGAKNYGCDTAHSLPLMNAAYERLCFLFFSYETPPNVRRLGSVSFVGDASTSLNNHGGFQ